MELCNKLNIKNRQEFRLWLTENSETEMECWVVVKRGKPTDNQHFWYIDAVEEALCFGWIDSVWKNIDGIMWSRFSPRKKNSPWTELNKERVRRLEQLDLMTDAGRKVLPDMKFIIDPDIKKDIISAGLWEQFASFPPLYQRVRAYNLAYTKSKSEKDYEKSFAYFIKQTKKGKMYGEWNDYGRLNESDSVY